MGRRVALQWTMVGIFVPTTLIGILPTYQEWGISSTIILICCRLFQGIFLSGETDGARILLYESFLKDRPTLINCLVGLSCYLGIFLASFAVSLIPLSVESSIWRLPFIIGGFLGAIIFIIRRFLCESTDYLQYQQSIKNHNAMKESETKLSQLAFLGTILLCGGVGGLYHIFFVFLGSYLSNVMGLVTNAQIQVLTPLMLFIHIIAQIGAAWLADHWSPQKVISTGILLTLPIILVLFYQLSYQCVHLGVLLLIAIPLALIFTPGFNLILSRTAIGKRYRFVSLGHSVGSVLLSGSAPAVSLFLWHKTQLGFAPLLHALALCLCVQIGVSLLIHSPKEA